jgi:hypothetical protein
VSHNSYIIQKRTREGIYNPSNQPIEHSVEFLLVVFAWINSILLSIVPVRTFIGCEKIVVDANLKRENANCETL